MADPYWVCESCGHFWASPQRPDRCENCRDGLMLTKCADADDAGEQSQVINDLILIRRRGARAGGGPRK